MKSIEELSDEELVTLYRTVEDNDLKVDLEKELFNRFSKWILAIASKFRYRDREDLCQVGWLGLIKAINGFQPSKGKRFRAYARRFIEGEIKHYLRDRADLIRRPGWLKNLISKCLRLIERYDNLSLEQLADKLNIKQDGLLEVIRAIIYVDYDIDISKLRSQRLESFTLPVEDKILLEQLLQKLTDMERKVIYYVFEMDISQVEIGKILKVSQRTVGRILSRAIAKMQKEVMDDLPKREEGGERR